MSDVSVGHDEMNIAVTIVTIQAAVRAGVAPVPDVVRLCPPGLEHHGWRQAAIAHLDRKKNALRHQPDGKKEDTFRELNEEFDYYERRARQR